MKRVVLMLSIALMGLMIGCTYDDRQVWDAIDKLNEKVANQQALLNALSNDLSIRSITETKEGYVITFSDKSTITIKQGNDEVAGAEGVIVAVDWDEDNAYFTMSDGSVVTIPLTVVGGIDDSRKIYYKTSGGSKIIPQFPSYAGAVMLSNTYDAGIGCMAFDDNVLFLDRWFSNQPTLTTIYLPNGIRQLFETFAGCTRLEEVAIPESVEMMDQTVFDGCSNLRYIYCKPQTPPTALEGMLTLPADAVIYVPSASVAQYKAAAGWDAYADNIVGCNFETVSDNYDSWLGDWTVSGAGLGWKDNQGYVTATNVSFDITISQKLEDGLFVIDGWNDQPYQLIASYCAAQDAFYIAGQDVATNVALVNGQVASRVVLVGLDAAGGVHTNYDMVCVRRSGKDVVATPVQYQQQDGSVFTFASMAYIAVVDGVSYSLSEYASGTELTLTPKH